MVIDFKQYGNCIDTSALKMNIDKLDGNIILPAKEEVHSETLPEHTAEAIKKMDDIERISKYLIENNRYRDNMLFIIGINFGLRVSDLRILRFCNLINDNLTFKDSFPVYEIKTRHTRKRKMNRYVTINTAVKNAVIMYLEHTPDVSLSDYMFKSVSLNATGENIPISRQAIDKMLKGLARDLNLNVHIATHSLRKTFAYWIMVQGNNDQRRLLLLQKIFGHSSPEITLQYIGISRDEIAEAYRNLNLGICEGTPLIDSKIVEFEDRAV